MPAAALSAPATISFSTRTARNYGPKTLRDNGSYTVIIYYEDYSYYFLSCDFNGPGPAKRIPVIAANGAASTTTTSFNDYYADDVDSFNVGSMGKVWWGHRMNSMNSASLNQSFNIRLGAVTGPVTVETHVGNTSDASNNSLRLSF